MLSPTRRPALEEVPGPTMPSIEARSITHRFEGGAADVTAVDDVSLALEAGEFVAILGPSGSGKTTLLSVLGGLLTPTAGEVRIGGTSLRGMKSAQLTELRARQVGFVFQTHNLVPYLTARENLEIVGGMLAGNPGALKLRRRSRRLLEELGLDGRAGHLPSALSVGERQRVAVARALLNEPSVLLVDEPTASLDTERGDEVVAMLAAQATQRGVAIVMVTHDQRMAAHADRALLLRDGRLIDRGVADAVAST